MLVYSVLLSVCDKSWSQVLVTTLTKTRIKGLFQLNKSTILKILVLDCAVLLRMKTRLMVTLSDAPMTNAPLY